MATQAVRTLQNFVDGAYVDAAAETADTVVNPATGEVLAEAPRSTDADVDRAVAAARRAFERFSATVPGERQRMLLELADTIEAHGDELTELEVADAGKPVSAFRADELPAVVDQLRFFAGAARTLEGKAAGEYLEG